MVKPSGRKEVGQHNNEILSMIRQKKSSQALQFLLLGLFHIDHLFHYGTVL